MKLSKKACSITPSPTLAISAKAKKMVKEGIDVVGFGAGEPDFDTPAFIKQAAIEAINDGFTKYTPASGIPELKKAIVKKFKNDNNIEYDIENIMISNGAKHSLSNTLQAILNPGDEVLIPIPYWVSYPQMVIRADGLPVYINSSEENNFEFTKEDLENVITEKTKAIIINSPNNPTGMVYSDELLKMIADISEKNDLFIISDEIYESLVYDNKEHQSIVSLCPNIKDRTIIVNGVSKTYSMTGWRIGYTAANKEITKVMSNMQSHETSNPNSIAQIAALKAISSDKEEVEKMKKHFISRRDYMVEKINSIKYLSCSKPEGAFYVMMNISNLLGKKYKNEIIKGSDDFAKFLLENEKVAVVPGKGFGTDIHVRLSYAISQENIEKGLNRIENFIKELC